jgi:thiosulfate/3-mercaptopyruvate sulfurtransferase
MPRSVAHPDALVTTQWAQDHQKDPTVRFIEVDVDTAAYTDGHMPAAIGFNWQTQLNDPVRRDIPSRAEVERLLSRAGVAGDTLIALYGDNNNWFAAYAFWLFRYYGHERVTLIDGGRKKWLAENRPVTADVPTFPATHYKVKAVHDQLRAKRDFVLQSVAEQARVLVDVRSVPEFAGEIIAPPGMTETAQRAGHIPGAVNVPWSKAVNDDGTFKSPDDLAALYETIGVDPARETITYCRIGERSSHTWFALTQLLGHGKVRNYDGSWTEYGNLIDVPIANPSAGAA